MAKTAPPAQVASGLRWSQDICLERLGNPASFRWAQAVALDFGGDDDQWMAMLRKGLSGGARVGHLAIANSDIAYGELLGAPQGSLGGPKRSQERWTWFIQGSEITGIDYRPFVIGRFGPYSELAISTNDRTQRFGLDWSTDLDSFICAVRESAGFHRPFDGSEAVPLRDDGAYVSARNKDDKWQVLIYDPEDARVARFSGRPDLSWSRARDEPDQVTWRSITTRPDGLFEFGEAPTQLLSLADGAVTTQPNWEGNTFSSREYTEWAFMSADELTERMKQVSTRLSPTPGHVVLQGEGMAVDGYAPYQSTEDLEAQNLALGPIATEAYIESALAASVNRSGGFFKAPFYRTFIRDSVTPKVRDGDRVDLAMPAVIESGASMTPVGEGATKVKPRGKLNAGLIVTFDDRCIIAWSEGLIKMTPYAIELPYSEIVEVNKFTISAKMSKIPALEIMTSNRRIVVTFTNHPDCKANFTWWQDILWSRLTGWEPAFDGLEVIRWEKPSDS